MLGADSTNNAATVPSAPWHARGSTVDGNVIPKRFTLARESGTSVRLWVKTAEQWKDGIMLNGVNRENKENRKQVKLNNSLPKNNKKLIATTGNT